MPLLRTDAFWGAPADWAPCAPAADPPQGHVSGLGPLRPRSGVEFSGVLGPLHPRLARPGRGGGAAPRGGGGVAALLRPFRQQWLLKLLACFPLHGRRQGQGQALLLRRRARASRPSNSRPGISAWSTHSPLCSAAPQHNDDAASSSVALAAFLSRPLALARLRARRSRLERLARMLRRLRRTWRVARHHRYPGDRTPLPACLRAEPPPLRVADAAHLDGLRRARGRSPFLRDRRWSDAAPRENAQAPPRRRPGIRGKSSIALRLRRERGPESLDLATVKLASAL